MLCWVCEQILAKTQNSGPKLFHTAQTIVQLNSSHTVNITIFCWFKREHNHICSHNITILIKSKLTFQLTQVVITGQCDHRGSFLTRSGLFHGNLVSPGLFLKTRPFLKTRFSGLFRRLSTISNIRISFN